MKENKKVPKTSQNSKSEKPGAKGCQPTPGKAVRPSKPSSVKPKK
jgi:hypothetical protein